MTTPYIQHTFELTPETQEEIHSLTPRFGFGYFGKTIYYRTYSRLSPDGSQEHWPETVIRVIEGIFSIRKNHMITNRLGWIDEEWQPLAREMALSMFRMEWLPPGRGLWACGTQFVSEVGSAALNNCGAASTRDLILGITWTMDLLMCGCGIGFDTEWEGEAQIPDLEDQEDFIIPDSREGWVESVRRLMAAFIPDSSGRVQPYPIFDYSLIRPAGSPIRRFGGVASGPDPLKELHHRIRCYLLVYCNIRRIERGQPVQLIRQRENGDFEVGTFSWDLQRLFLWMAEDLRQYDHSDDRKFEELLEKIRQKPKFSYGRSRLVVDLLNSVGRCVIAGNVRRSAEIAIGRVGDEEFLELKNYQINPERMTIGWVSNNSLRFERTEDFQYLPELAHRVIQNGEPGFINLLNIQRHARVGDHHYHHLAGDQSDPAILSNPCGEIPLEPFELCNLAEVFPSLIYKQVTNDPRSQFFQALRYATFYASTVSLLPTHWEITNRVIARNHRIGVSLTGVADLYEQIGFTRLTELLRQGYRVVSEENHRLAREAGVKPSIRITTVKPSGTISLLAGVSPGMHFPIFRYAIRRVRVAMNSPLVPLLKEAGVPHEECTYSSRTFVFEFPVDNGKGRPANQVSLWEQFSILATLQREWSDNTVSATISFDPEKSDDLEHALAQHAPVIKTCSMLPNYPMGSYPQMPYEEINEEECRRRTEEIQEIDWRSFGGSDGIMPRNCANDVCDMTP